jgi:hypothetical protein
MNIFSFLFFFKDILREKQTHIEKLMNEREIEREETANQAILFQKQISQVMFDNFAAFISFMFYFHKFLFHF